MKKKFSVLALLCGLTLSATGIVQATFGPTGNYVDKAFDFAFRSYSPYDETESRIKYNTSYYYMRSDYTNVSYEAWARAAGHDASGGHYYTVSGPGVKLLYNLAIEKYCNLDGITADVTIGSKKAATGHAYGVWSPDYDPNS